MAKAPCRPAYRESRPFLPGSFQSLALKTDGTVVGWGEVASYDDTPQPADLAGVLAISQSGSSLALRDASSDGVPTITVEPISQTLAETQSVTFSVTAMGAGPFGYQWRKDGVTVSGATSPTLTLSNLGLTDAGNYDVVVSNHIGSTTSTTATLVVDPIPVVTSLSPTRQVLAPGQDLNLSVAATGTGTLHYQWVHNGHAITAATGAGFSQVGLALQDSGWYEVRITDDYGTRYAQPIFVLVALARTQVRSWGASAPVPIPAGLDDAISLSAGDGFALALRSDGTVATWGGPILAVTGAPAGPTDFVAISAGDGHALALKATAPSLPGAPTMPASATCRRD